MRGSSSGNEQDFDEDLDPLYRHPCVRCRDVLLGRAFLCVGPMDWSVLYLIKSVIYVLFMGGTPEDRLKACLDSTPERHACIEDYGRNTCNRVRKQHADFCREEYKIHSFRSCMFFRTQANAPISFCCALLPVYIKHPVCL
jgi:hypothetical protein